MSKHRLMIGVLAALLVAVAPQMGWAQTNIATGQVFGTCHDPDGAVMPGVIIQIKNNETGFNRSTVSDANGFFRVDLLPSGTYDVRADMSGFKSEIQRGIVVSLGSSVKVEFKLVLSAIQEEIVVTAASPVIETTNPDTKASVGDESIQNLPLAGRDFSDLAILVPGTATADGSQAEGRGGLNMGARAIQNSFNIDGSNNQSTFFGEERGGTRPPFTFSQAAIKEFQVIKTSYNLQYSAGGGVINAITMSGTNEFKGQVFGYYTDKDMRANDAFDREANTFEQTQFGFAIGGPIVRDKLHFFGSYDGQLYSTPYFAVWPGFPANRTAEWESITGLDYGTETGEITQTNDANVFLIKFDWQLSNKHLLTVRDNYSKQEAQNGTYSSSSTGRSNNGLEQNSFNSFVVSMNSIFGEDAFNELIVQYSAEQRPRAANNTTLPETSIYSPSAYFGRQDFLPNSLDENRFQLIDNFTYYMGKHTLKAGVNLDFASYDNWFYRYAYGAYSYDDWDTFFADTPYYFQQAYSPYDGRIKFDVSFYSLYAQDEVRLGSNLTLTYGLRYELQDNPSPDVCNPAYPDTCQIPDDKNNWSPRVGFAWDINGDGKSVLRGGGGYFYDITPTLMLSNAMNDNGVRTATIREYCRYGGCPSYPDTWDLSGGVPISGRPAIKAFDPDFENPETLRFSLGYDREIARDLAIGVDLIWSESKKLERSWNQNMEPDGGSTVDGLPTYVLNTVNPDVGEINQYTSDVDASYRAIAISLNKRFSNGWLLNTSYTYSKAKDENSNERATTSYPFDQFLLDLSWGPSNFDTTHKFVASATYQLPLDFMVSGILYIRSGFPYSAYDSRDTNTDGQNYNELALVEVSDGVYERYNRNTFNHPYFRTLDLRLSKTFRFGRGMGIELIADIFNVTNEANYWTTNDTLVDRYGNINDYFGELDQVGDPRSWQLGLRFTF